MCWFRNAPHSVEVFWLSNYTVPNYKMPFFQSGEKRLFYHRVDAGAAQKAAAPTLVFIHGLGSSHAFYGSVMNQLAGAGYSSAALDVHGRSYPGDVFSQRQV